MLLAIPAVAVLLYYVRRAPDSARPFYLLAVPLLCGLTVAKSAQLPVLLGGVAVLLLVLVCAGLGWLSAGQSWPQSFCSASSGYPS